MNNKFLLLIGTGAALGCNFPLGKLALAAGVDPALWAATISLGAGLALLVITTLTERTTLSFAAHWQFSIISGFLSYVVPNGLTFLVMPKIGSGLAAVMFALSPVTTALLSIVFRVQPPKFFGLIGIAFGFLGAIIITLSRNGTFSLSFDQWILMALLIPVFLACGNVYRTWGWPAGASPRQLAACTNLAAVPFLVAFAAAHSGSIDFAPLIQIPGLIAIQLAVSTFMFLLFFRLQQLGGPTYLSQIGYVAAAVGVALGLAVFGETYPSGVWLGIALIAVGIAIATYDQFRHQSVKEI
jgi:drug/metabolite transporter (DMT)-like permease